MNKILGLIVLVLAFGIPTLAQSRMSPDDEARFNSYYSRWMHDQQTGNRDDMASMEGRMQDLMSRYGIPSNTPYDVIAQGENGGYYGDRDRDRDHDRDRDRGYGNWRGQAQLSPDDQRRFDEEYAKWQQSTARNDRDDINKHARNMENIMARYNIPPNTPFDEIASNGGAGYGAYNGNYNGSYGGTYGRRGYQGMLSPGDQQRFDSAYQHWIHERQEGDRAGMERQERTMQDIMARYNIPQNVPYDAIASGGQGY